MCTHADICTSICKKIYKNFLHKLVGFNQETLLRSFATPGVEGVATSLSGPCPRPPLPVTPLPPLPPFPLPLLLSLFSGFVSDLGIGDASSTLGVGATLTSLLPLSLPSTSTFLSFPFVFPPLPLAFPRPRLAFERSSVRFCCSSSSITRLLS